MNNDNTQRNYGYDTTSDSNVHYVPSQTGTNTYTHQSGSNKRRRKNTLPDQLSNDFIPVSRGSDQVYGQTQIRDMQTPGYPSCNYQHNSIPTQNNTSQSLTFDTTVNNPAILNNTRSLSIDSNHSIYGQSSKSCKMPSSSKMSLSQNINPQRQTYNNINGIENQNWYFQNNLGHTNQMLSNGQFATQDINPLNQDIFSRQQMAMMASAQGQQRPIHAIQPQSTDHNSMSQQNYWVLSQPFYIAQPIEPTINNPLQSDLSPTFNSITPDPRMSINQTQQFSQNLMEIDKVLDRLNSLNETDQITLCSMCDDIINYIKDMKKYAREITSDIQHRLFQCFQLIRECCRDDGIKSSRELFQIVVDNIHLFSEYQVQMQGQLRKWLNELNQNQIYYPPQRSASRSDKQPIAVSDNTSAIIGSHGTSRISNCPTRPVQLRATQSQPSLPVAQPIPQRRNTSSNTERIDRSKWAGRLIDHAWSYGISPYYVQSVVQQSFPHLSVYPLAKESIYISQETFNRIWRSETPKLPINSTPSQLPLTYRLISRRTKNIDIDPKSDKCDWSPEEVSFSVTINNNAVKLERKQRIMHNGVEQYQGVDRPEREISIQVFAWESQEFVLRLARLQRLTFEHGLSIAKVKQSRPSDSNGSHDIIHTNPIVINENLHCNPGHAITTIDDDDDVTAYKMTVSLKCPLSMVRIKEPAKGLYCVHIGCFDLETYVQVNMVHTKWTCPMCNGIVTSETLRVDDYFIKLLEKFSSNVSKIAVDSDGTWSIVEQDDDIDSSDDENSNVKRRDPSTKESSVTLINEAQMPQPNLETVRADIISPSVETVRTDIISSTSEVHPAALDSLALVASTQMHLPQPPEMPETSSHQISLLLDPLPSPDTNNDATTNNEFKSPYRTQEANPSTSTPPNDKDPPSDNDRWEEYEEEEVEIVCDWTINPLY
ncbi:25464_t:CDS:10 [Dentiscutata erythropus]|uniref:25464_t:CDS:1 n=1 Tax=Dentiscutata erythropus TaxID=1348616 RepID=A0A9N9HHF5_9GLOM|nr:25464_t:CDS:10 [Dentiscutata erythropus]